MTERSIGAVTKPSKKRWVRGAVLQILAMVGIGLLLYPQAADWFGSFGRNSEITSYFDNVADTPSEERQRILNAGYTYNDQLEPGPLTDPYLSMAEDAELQSEVYRAYEEMLKVSGTDAIGTLSYPEVDIALPIYHGTTDDVISRGVGHMYGTSLPIGGPSTRSVLTAHSGLINAELFTPLHDSEEGDIFWISVLGEDHYYKVQAIETVLPNETGSLQIIEGEDWVTLFTCTPIGVNSHRLLVHAVRIDPPETVEEERIISSEEISVGFPWWTVWFIGGSLLVALILFAPGRKKGQKASAKNGAGQ